MSIHICFSALLLTSAILTSVNSQDAVQEYVIRKDFFTGVKAGEFSIYDASDKHIQYRIESDYGGLQKLRLIAYPSKQEVGRLQARLNLLLYKADISVLDSKTNQWINGLIEQNFKVLGSSFNIDWNNNRITMETDVGSITAKFFDTNNELLAQYRLRPASVLWTNKYDMKIFSNKYPEQIYLLALATRDHIKSSKRSG